MLVCKLGKSYTHVGSVMMLFVNWVQVTHVGSVMMLSDGHDADGL